MQEIESVEGFTAGGRRLLFTSANRELRASALSKPLTLPPHGGHLPDSLFQQAIQNALEEARRAGQVNPIVMGAIPFDPHAPSCLYVPQHYAWQARSEAPSPTALQYAPPKLVEQRSFPDEGGFKRAVEQAIVNFGFGELRKAVLSVVHELRFAAPLDVERLLDGLAAQNPIGYRFRIPVEDGSELIGASPELLLCKQAERVVSNPLAGTAKRQPVPESDREAGERLMRSTKDLYEHRLVIDEVVRVLRPYCTELVVPEHPALLATPTLWHLSTRIEGQLREPTTTALQLACQLHPTPAVCGYPTQDARHLIQLIEPFERGLFTGMVGWSDMQGNGEWVVTIRCGNVKRDVIRLFAGAGIVAASHPEAEWEEVQAKLGTMRQACGLSVDEGVSNATSGVTS
ncbi:isochorismate synthase [Billgrantia endophytica]|uniref:isochorismate synthase n=2 Tax=Billgrantia endophytica TaxID=2033802 RepID=A0A2N7TZL1_9GAMM|nr:isochorismate synthase [Halomonas endophytica]